MPADGNLFKASSIISNGGDFMGSYCAIRLVENAVYCWGFNAYGNCGNGNPAMPNVQVPTKVVSSPAGDTAWNVNITQIVTTPGRNYYNPTYGYGPYLTTCALRSDGTVWCWGYNGTYYCLLVESAVLLLLSRSVLIASPFSCVFCGIIGC